MGADFVHLHVHSEFSMLDGAVRPADLAAYAAEQGARAVALTDHGVMHGAVRFFTACEKAGIAPILGCEVDVLDVPLAEAGERSGAHLVLLAASQKGYQHIVRLVSHAWTRGLSARTGRPRVDMTLLSEHLEDVVVLTGCLGGLLPQRILHEGEEAGAELLGRLREMAAPGHLFVELQDHGFPEQQAVNEILVDLARHQDVPLVATNDVHYLRPEDAQAQLALQCIASGVPLAEATASHHGSSELYFKRPEEMAERFASLPEALRNTLRVAEMCAGSASPLSRPKLPRFPVPEGRTETEHLRRLAEAGLRERLEELRAAGLPFDIPTYEARLAHELQVIEQTGYPGYFLIVADFINWAKRNDVPVGPGRGSGAGSLVAWALRITDLDPIRYGLLFERFLNAERVSMPDFDVDFCMDRRDRVIDYIREKYGQDSVGQIATFHELKSRSVVRDVGRVMGMAAQDAGRVATMIPEPVQGRTVSIAQALDNEARLRDAYEHDGAVRTLLDTARALEGLTRHAGMHAAGVVISEGPLWEHVPVFCPEPGQLVTQYDKDDVESAGLVKFDFLGLKTLTTIDLAVRLVDRRPDRTEPLRIDRIPLDDPATFALLQSGDTTGVFQLESSGMQELFRQLRPDRFEDLIAAIALYRPGPLGSDMHKRYVERKHGREPVDYPHPSLDAILSETYGVVVYQEQVMEIARQMAGYSLGAADLLRRAMGKKKPEEMGRQRSRFVEGAIAKGNAREDAERVFAMMEKFAAYGFNKSHSAAYALIAYQTAWLKAHYPVEFMCATMSTDRDKVDKVVRTVAEARAMGITVLPPDVNESQVDFTVVYDPDAGRGIRPRKDRPVAYRGKLRDPMAPRIRFGLGALKGLGGAALDAIFEARTGESTVGRLRGEHARGAEQPFTDLYDFCSRVDLRRVNKSCLEALVQCGAFDAVHEPLGVDRAQAFAAIADAIERGKQAAADRASGQTSLLGLLSGGEAGEAAPSPAPRRFPQVLPWDTIERLEREKRALGFYVSGHPLDRYAGELRRFRITPVDALASMADGAAATVAGMVEGYRERTSARGRFAFFHLEDHRGRVEVVVRSAALEAEGTVETLRSGKPVLLQATVQLQRRGDGTDDELPEPRLVLQEASTLEDELVRRTRRVVVRLPVADASRERLTALRATLRDHPGECPVWLELTAPGRWTAQFQLPEPAVQPGEALLAALERLFGRKVAELR